MKRVLFVMATIALFTACSSDDNDIQSPIGGGKEKQEHSYITVNYTETSASLTISSSVPTKGLFTKSGVGAVEYPKSSQVYNSKADLDKCSESNDLAVATCFVRIDCMPENEDKSPIYVGQSSSAYFPKSRNDGTERKVNRYIYPSRIEGDDYFVVDQYGVRTKQVFAEGQEPTVDDFIPYFDAYLNDNVKGVKSIVYRGDTIYTADKSINRMDEFTIIWYVVKWQSRDDRMIHIDGALVPKGKISASVGQDEKEDLGGPNDKTQDTFNEADESSISFPTGVDKDLILRADDFDIRKSGQDAYVYYSQNIDVNSLSYKDVTISRGSDMKITVDGLNKLDWDNEEIDSLGNPVPVIWSFETWLWASLDVSEFDSWNRDEVGTIDNTIYNVSYNIHEGFESNGTVPFVKASIHISKK